MDSSVKEIKKLLKNWHFYKACILNGEGAGLKKKVEAVERYINTLDEVDRKIIRMRFFERAEVNFIANKLFKSRRAVYYRIDGIVKEIVDCLEMTG